MIRAAVLVLFALGVAALAAAGRFGWERFEPNRCIVERRCFCEAATHTLVQQPANTASNLGFLVAAFVIARELDRRRIRGREVLGAMLVAFLGVGSMCLHATLTATGGRIDVASMLLFATFLVAGVVAPAASNRFAAALAAITAASLSIYALEPRMGTPLFGALALGYGALAIGRGGTRWLAAAGALFLASFALWLPSQTDGPLCIERSLLQGHAAWHLGCAAAAWCLFKHRQARAGFTSDLPSPRAPLR